MTAVVHDGQAPLAGLRVIDLSHTLPGAMATQFLADCGADVLLVERPGGSPLRDTAGWPVLSRGKQSVELDVFSEAGRASLGELLATADASVTTFKPATLRALGLDGASLSATYPRLVSAAITGFGPTGPLADLPGYEAVVMAKLGYLHLKRLLAARPGPAFVSFPFASWGAAHTTVHGILAGWLEREGSGAGQHVDADLARGVHSLDTWAWFLELVGLRWPDAYSVVEAFNEDGELQAPLIYPLLAAPTSDGVWLQFAQTEPRLFLAQMKEFGLAHLFAEPKWEGLPVLKTQELRTELWEMMIGKVAERTYAEWQQVFATNPDVSAEVYRGGIDPLDHPQLQHEGRSVVLDDPERGPVRQPQTLVYAAGRPVTALRPAPRLGEHDSDSGPATGAGASPPASSAPPLAGVTVLELGLMFAAPYGATLLADLGARVIKVETLAGDTIRRIQSFPESGGAKVLSGKESIQVDLTTPEGLEIVQELARRSDVVLQSWRAGAAARAHLDAETVTSLNPGVVYVNAPGYGTDGPYGARPAYAPSIGAAAGIARTDAAHARSELDSMASMRHSAMQLYHGTAVVPMQADGVAALGVASTMLLGLLAARRSRPLPALTATMLGTNVLANPDRLADYPGMPETQIVDEDYRGYGALYQLYETADGWLFLAAPKPADWAALTAVLGEDAPVPDERFASSDGRREHDADLAATLGKVFSQRTAAEWEALLLAGGVAAVAVLQGSPQRLLQADPDLAAEYTRTVTSPVYEEHLRLGPLTRFSRSETPVKGFCLAGEQTDAILGELGYDAAAIADLRERKVVA